MSGVTEENIDYYELGRHDISLSDMFKLACALGVEMRVLLE